MRKRIIAFLLAIVTSFSVLVLPVSAAENPSLGDRIVSFFGSFFEPNLISPLASAVGAFLGDGKTPETATESDWKNAYNQYNTTINTTYGTTQFCANGYIIPLTFRGVTYPSWGIISTKFTTNTDAFAFDHGVDGAVVFSSIPSIGKVTLIEEAYVSSSYGASVRSVGSGLYYSIPGVSGSDLHLNPGFPISVRPGGTVKILTSGRVYLSSGVVGDFSCQLRFALYYVPDVLPDIVTNIDTRTGSLAGNFGYYGDNGQLIAAENMTIVNETNNTYTNPQTGVATPILDWTYDYGDRSYTLSLDGELSAKVVFGDENVTIKEGDTVYNIYYLTTGGGTGPVPSPTPGPGGCAHKYTSTVTTAPACLTAGVKTFTCSLCSDTYTEKTPATGHTWVLDRTVNSEYDTDGKVTVQGYSIYKCSVCGNEYKDTEGTGPPDSGGESGGGFLDWLLGKIGELLGSIGNGVLTLLKTALGKIFDGVIGIIDMITEKLSQILDALFKIFDNVPKMFDGFTLFLTNCFAFLPPEIMTFLTFGVLAMVLIAIFRFFLGK